MGTPREELEEYREKVFSELRARALRVQELDGSIASTNRLLESAGPARALRSGDTLRALAGVSQKGKLRRELDRLRRQRSEAAADLKRAEERLEDVDRELQELDSNEVEQEPRVMSDDDRREE